MSDYQACANPENAKAVASEAIDLLTATAAHLDTIAATLRAIRNAYPAAFAELSDGIRSGLLDTRHLTDMGLNAVADWHECLIEQTRELSERIENCGDQGVAHA